jgi:1-acyl-sn-glycerol-3-phosphate acyltransferase
VTTLRRLLFAAWLYLAIALCGIAYIPLLLGPRRFANRAIALWARIVIWGFKRIVGVRIEVRGLEHAPRTGALVAGKHQSMLDICAPFLWLDDPCFVFKKELLWTPFVGMFALKAGMIPVDRSGHAAALKKMVADTQGKLDDGRQIIIFPEGTRTEPGAEPSYKPGIAALYRELGAPCHLLATNAGRCWPAHGIGFNPGVAIYEFLEPIPAGLKRGEFMKELQARLETASRALL